MSDVSTPEGYFSEEQTAARLAVKVQTLRVWACNRKGPPRTVIARRALYRREALENWLRAREQNFDFQQTNRFGGSVNSTRRAW